MIHSKPPHQSPFDFEMNFFQKRRLNNPKAPKRRFWSFKNHVAEKSILPQINERYKKHQNIDFLAHQTLYRRSYSKQCLLHAY